MLNHNNTLLLDLNADNPRVTAKITYTGDINITKNRLKVGNTYKIIYKTWFKIVNTLLGLSDTISYQISIAVWDL